MAEELAAYAKADRAASVAPTVVALRAKAATVVESELARLERRLAGLDARTRREIAQAMGRVADKLLHGPTVRVKELAGSPGVGSYEDALRVLFELEQDAVESLITPEVGWPGRPGGRGRAVTGTPLRIGSRKSPMAMAQSGHVADLLTARTGRAVQIVGLSTFGDVSKAQLAQIGGTGVFVSTLPPAAC